MTSTVAIGLDVISDRSASSLSNEILSLAQTPNGATTTVSLAVVTPITATVPASATGAETAAALQAEACGTAAPPECTVEEESPSTRRLRRRTQQAATFTATRQLELTSNETLAAPTINASNVAAALGVDASAVAAIAGSSAVHASVTIVTEGTVAETANATTGALSVQQALPGLLSDSLGIDGSEISVVTTPSVITPPQPPPYRPPYAPPHAPPQAPPLPLVPPSPSTSPLWPPSSFPELPPSSPPASPSPRTPLLSPPMPLPPEPSPPPPPQPQQPEPTPPPIPVAPVAAPVGLAVTPTSPMLPTDAQTAAALSDASASGMTDSEMVMAIAIVVLIGIITVLVVYVWLRIRREWRPKYARSEPVDVNVISASESMGSSSSVMIREKRNSHDLRHDSLLVAHEVNQEPPKHEDAPAEDDVSGATTRESASSALARALDWRVNPDLHGPSDHPLHTPNKWLAQEMDHVERAESQEDTTVEPIAPALTIQSTSGTPGMGFFRQLSFESRRRKRREAEAKMKLEAPNAAAVSGAPAAVSGAPAAGLDSESAP